MDLCHDLNQYAYDRSETEDIRFTGRQTYQVSEKVLYFFRLVGNRHLKETTIFSITL